MFFKRNRGDYKVRSRLILGFAEVIEERGLNY